MTDKKTDKHLIWAVRRETPPENKPQFLITLRDDNRWVNKINSLCATRMTRAEAEKIVAELNKDPFCRVGFYASPRDIKSTTKHYVFNLQTNRKVKAR